MNIDHVDQAFDIIFFLNRHMFLFYLEIILSIHQNIVKICSISDI